jgi:alpha-1,6-mannosyltransferase
LKILHIANFYGPKSGGIKTTIHDLGRRYEAAGHQFTFVVPGINLSKTTTPYGSAIYLPSREIPFSGGYRIFKGRKSIRQAIVLSKPDRIECSDRFTLMFLGPWARRMGIQTVVFSHETLSGLVAKFLPATKLLQRFVDWHNRRLSKAFDFVIATTKFASTEFERITTPNLRLIPLGVDTETFTPNLYDAQFKKELLQGSQHLLVHCGRLSPEKDPHLSIEATKNLLKMGFDVRLVIVGGGPLIEKMRKLAEDLPVSFTGYIANPAKIARMMAAADVAIAPGPLETFCLSAMESLSCGTPVVANSNSAVGEFLFEHSAKRCGATAHGNGQEFANKIAEILEGPSLRRNARAVAKSFTWERTISELLNIHEVRDKAA